MTMTDLGKLAEKFAEEITAKASAKAYQQGWSDAMEAIGKTVANAVAAAQLAPPQSPNNGVLPLFPPQTKVSPFRQGSDMGKLFDYMKVNQGLTGANLIKGMQASGINIEERTARTALHRMKNRGYAINEGGRWFVK